MIFTLPITLALAIVVLCAPMASRAASDALITVAPAVTICQRPGITGAGWAVLYAEPVGVGRSALGSRVVCLYPTHPDDAGKSVGTGCSESRDAGRTWTAGLDDTPFPGMVDLWVDRLRYDKLICFGLRALPGREPAAPAESAYAVAFSPDNGLTWKQEDATIHCPAELGVITRPLPHIFEENDGTLYMPAYASGQTGKCALLLQSGDQGRNWGVASTIATDQAIRASGAPVTTPWLETAVARTADGSLLAVIRTGSSAQAALVTTRSTDHGATWGPVKKVVAGPSARVVAGKLPSLCLLLHGELALLTAHTKNHCRLYLSQDGTGEEWREGFIITSQSGSNTSMTATGVDDLLVFTPANGRIDSWQVNLRPGMAEPSPLAAPANVTVSGEAMVRVSWTASAGAEVHHYLVTPILVRPPAGKQDAEILLYAPIATRDAATQLDLGRKLLLGATYRFEVAAVDRAGRRSPAAASAEAVVGTTPQRPLPR